jgi:hypothetical protein
MSSQYGTSGCGGLIRMDGVYAGRWLIDIESNEVVVASQMKEWKTIEDWVVMLQNLHVRSNLDLIKFHFHFRLDRCCLKLSHE